MKTSTLIFLGLAGLWLVSKSGSPVQQLEALGNSVGPVSLTGLQSTTTIDPVSAPDPNDLAFAHTY